MNNIERRALYNLLRMNWLNEPSLAVENWQIEDYRVLSLPLLFERLKGFNIHLDRASFAIYAEDVDSPEDLADELIGDHLLQAKEADQIYLLIFELWRRLITEKRSLSIVCNELDYQIDLYDRQKFDDPFALQDALTHFVEILENNVDQGILPEEVMSLISTHFANHVETFLYNFIAEQIDEGNDAYAYELLEDFDHYLHQNKWFKLLRIRLSHLNHRNFEKMTHEITEEHLDDQDLDYYLEFLSILAEKEDIVTFKQVMPLILQLLETEEDFQNLLIIMVDYLHRLDQNKQEMIFMKMIEKRQSYPLSTKIQANDPDLIILTHFFTLR